MPPLLLISAAFLLGLLLAAWVSVPWPVWTGLSLLFALLAVFERRVARRFPSLESRLSRLPVPAALLLASLFAGALRFQLSHPALGPSSAAYYNDQGEFLLRGWIDAYPEERGSRLRLTVQSGSLQPLLDGKTAGDPIPVRGRVLVDVPLKSGWSYGDRLEVRGKLQTPPEGETFSYRDALARENVFSLLSAYTQPKRLPGSSGSPLLRELYALRASAYRVVNQIFPQPEAALLNGILLGLDQDLPAPLSDAFKATGTAHIIAISGFNIAILAGLFSGLFGKIFTRWWALLAAVLAIAVYSLLAGGEPSVVRAAVMGGLALFGREIGRRSAGLNTLVFTAAIMCLFDPNLPWDASFQLSFTATLGLVLYAGPLDRAFRGFAGRFLSAEWVNRAAGPVGEYFLFTLAAQITTLPVMAYHFQRFSITSLISNPLALPPQPLLMILGGIAVIAGLVWLPLGRLLAFAALPFAAYTVRVVELLGRIPGGQIELKQFGMAFVLAWFLALFGFTALRRFPQLRSALRPGLALTAAGIAAVVIWQFAAAQPDGRLRLTLMNQDSGPVLLLQTPSGRALLVNAVQASDLSGALGQRLPPTAREIDGLLLTRPPAKNASAVLALSSRFPVAWIAAPDPLWETKSTESLEKDLLAAGQQTRSLSPGSWLDLGQGARLEVLYADENGAALWLEWGSLRLLIPGGIQLDDQPAERLRSASALVLEDRDLSAGLENWLALNPQVVLLALGQDASPEVSSSRLVQVAPGQWLQLTTDGGQFWLERGDN